MSRYFEKKTGIIWFLATILLFYYIFYPILRELITAFLVAIAIGIIILVATNSRKHLIPNSTN